jgi:hypothetical protein
MLRLHHPFPFLVPVPVQYCTVPRHACTCAFHSTVAPSCVRSRRVSPRGRRDRARGERTRKRKPGGCESASAQLLVIGAISTTQDLLARSCKRSEQSISTQKGRRLGSRPPRPRDVHHSHIRSGRSRKPESRAAARARPTCRRACEWSFSQRDFHACGYNAVITSLEQETSRRPCRHGAQAQLRGGHVSTWQHSSERSARSAGRCTPALRPGCTAQTRARGGMRPRGQREIARAPPS